MTTARLPRDQRETTLKLALLRIQQGRARTKATKVSIASVAAEAGVSAALIHNHYPAIAEAIRQAQGDKNQPPPDAERTTMKKLQLRLKELHEELDQLKEQRRRLASINEVLRSENAVLRASEAGNVIRLRGS